MHNLQKAAVTNIRVRRSTLKKQEKHSEKAICKIKAKMQRTQQKVREEEESKQKLTNIINIACSNLKDIEILQEMPPEDKVVRLGKIVSNLRRKLTKLEEKIRPNIAP